MTLFKAVFNGIGSGAGVAWPLFGIVFTVIGGAVGSILSFAMGGVALGLFLAVTLSIGVFSFRQMKQEEEALQQMIIKNENKLLSIIEYYFKLLQPNIPNVSRSLTESLPDIQLDNRNSNEAFRFLLASFRKKSSEIHNFYRSQEVLDEVKSSVARAQLSLVNPLISSLFGFVGTFGAIAGCSAGLSGMLTGVGVLTSLAAFPLIGWGVIGVAFGLGVYSALGSFRDALAKERQQHLNSSLKALQKDMKHHIDEMTGATAQSVALKQLGAAQKSNTDCLTEETAVHKRKIILNKTYSSIPAELDKNESKSILRSHPLRK